MLLTKRRSATAPGLEALKRAADLAGELAALLGEGSPEAVGARFEELSEVVEALPPYVSLELVAFYRTQEAGIRREWQRDEHGAARYQMNLVQRRLGRLYADLS